MFQRCFIQTGLVRDYQSGNQFILRFLRTVGDFAVGRFEKRPSWECWSLASSIPFLWIENLERGCIPPLCTHPSPWQASNNTKETKRKQFLILQYLTLIFTNSNISHLKLGALKSITFMKKHTSTILSFSFCLLPENTTKVLLGWWYCSSIAIESLIRWWRYPSACKKDYSDNDCFWDTK